MFRQPITLSNISFVLSHKTCFQDFSVQIHYGDRIAIIGNNGSGKSTLLSIIQGWKEPTHGTIKIPDGSTIGYVPQQILNAESLSGGQRFQDALSQALAQDPDVLLLDEPTNNLDARSRKSLMRMLQSYPGTLIVVSHDVTLLRTCIDTLWHIDNGTVHTFVGSYDDYLEKTQHQKNALEHEIALLNRAKKESHKALMKEQKRSKKNSSYGKKQKHQARWSPTTAGAKERQAQATTGRNNKNINKKKHALIEQLSELYVPEIIIPKFSLLADTVNSKIVVAVSHASVGYTKPIVTNITLSVNCNDRVAIAGDNGSGKSTLLKALLSDPTVTKTGDWSLLPRRAIGYLDQHYAILNPEKSIFCIMQQAVPNWGDSEIRRHLNDFLFRKNEEVMARTKTLSGGEKARASLALIAAKPPQLLVLDEITNNLDMQTREHVIQVLDDYLGAMIVVSHDENFLNLIGVTATYTIHNRVLQKASTAANVINK